MATAEKTWREVGANFGDKAIDFKKSAVGATLEGTYLGARTITTRFGDNQIFSFENDEGPFSVYGFTDLTTKMGEVQAGDDVRLTYMGMETIKSKTRGQVDMHRVRVEVA